MTTINAIMDTYDDKELKEFLREISYWERGKIETTPKLDELYERFKRDYLPGFASVDTMMVRNAVCKAAAFRWFKE